MIRGFPARQRRPTNKIGRNPAWPTPRPTVSRPIRDSPHYNAEVLERDVGVRFKGVEKTNVAEYCVSEGWIRVEAGKTKDRHGNPLTIKLTGPVEVYFRHEKQGLTCASVQRRAALNHAKLDLPDQRRALGFGRRNLRSRFICRAAI